LSGRDIQLDERRYQHTALGGCRDPHRVPLYGRTVNRPTFRLIRLVIDRAAKEAHKRSRIGASGVTAGLRQVGIPPAINRAAEVDYTSKRDCES
jgi:hypothetical protein